MNKTIGKRIKECRVKMGMTQEELAEALYTKKCTISAYETGKIDIKVSILNILASGNHNSGAVETYIPDTETAFDWLNYHP